MDLKNVYVAVINLKRSPDRREYMERQLEACQLPFTILEATDGSAHTFTPEDSASLSQGELGCALSHRRALQTFLDSSALYALIMEDDIEMSDRFPTTFSTILSSLNAVESTYIQFDYAPVGVHGVQFWWFLFLNMARNNKGNFIFWMKVPWYLLKGLVANIFTIYEGVRNSFFQRYGNTTTPARKDRYLAGCYLLTREAAVELISLNTPIRYTADAVHNVARKKKLIRHRIAVPRVVRQKRETFHSTLQDIHFGKKIISY